MVVYIYANVLFAMVEEQLIFQNGVIYSKVFKIEATIIN